MSDLIVRSFQPADRARVIALWERCGLTRPWNDPNLDIDRKSATDPDGFLIGVADDLLVASVMAGYDGHRGWVNYLAVDPDRRGTGWGRTIMGAAEALLAGRGCPKVNLQIRTSNMAAVRFYESIGYTFDDVVSMGRRLVDDAEG